LPAVGSQVDSFGMGRNVAGGDANVEDGTTGAGRLRRATFQVDWAASPGRGSEYETMPTLSGQAIWHGDSGGPDYAAGSSTLTGIHLTSDGVSHATMISIDGIRGWVKRVRHAPGDINRDRRGDNGIARADIVFSAVPSTSNTLIVGLSQGNGGFTEFDAPLSTDFPSWSRQPGAKTVTGDFNGDGYGDVALVGGIGWASIPTAIYSPGSQGGPFFAVNNTVSANFAATAATAGVQPVGGDFNGDGWSDIALVGGGQGGVRVAYSNTADSSSTFSIQDVLGLSPAFLTLITTPGARVLAGDFDGDDIDDLALVGGQGWASIPMELAATGSPNFPFQRFTNGAVTDFGAWAQQPGARPVVGDFNGDGRDDIALTGGQNWLSVPVAFSVGDGTFTVTNQVVVNIPQWAQTPGVQAVSGDYDGDGRDDIALAGGQGWASIPVAFSNGDGTFNVTNVATGLAGPAQQGGTRIVSGH